MASDTHKQMNKWVARVIPLILAGLIGYSSWVVVREICSKIDIPRGQNSTDARIVDYLIKPSKYIYSARPGAAIAILALYFTFLLLMTISFLRVISAIIVETGFIERGPNYESSRSRAQRRSSTRSRTDSASHRHGERRRSRSRRRDPEDNVQLAGVPYDPEATRPTGDKDGPDLSAFYTKKAFICEGDGRPKWCTKCLNWKPDRTHHCREIDRCVRKMDHFCPWVGGIVSERNFKFFIVFTFWTAMYCIHTLTFTAIFVSEVKRAGEALNVHWAIVLGLGGLFLFFSAGISISSLQLAVLNSTSVEALSRSTIVHTIAVYLPNPPAPGEYRPYQTITYPFENRPDTDPPSSSDTASASALSPRTSRKRTFAILRTPVGANPWNLGYLGNLKSVLGDHIYDWFFPFKNSPLTDHDRYDSEFQFGPVVDQLRRDYHIIWPGDNDGSSRKKRRRHRSRRRTHGAEEEMNEKGERRQDGGTGVRTVGGERDLEAGVIQ
ncbi:palmitoyltransferase pfa5 [Agyrium rufum]|nr:palmitoyltransferase pfa5 [Agyrium rufum]